MWKQETRTKKQNVEGYKKKLKRKRIRNVSGHPWHAKNFSDINFLNVAKDRRKSEIVKDLRSIVCERFFYVRNNEN